MSGSYTPTDFFETCAMLITFILAGKYMECAVKRKTSEAITGLLQLAPDTALLVELDKDNRVRSQEQVGCQGGGAGLYAVGRGGHGAGAAPSRGSASTPATSGSR
jgi:hypothetical protein